MSEPITLEDIYKLFEKTNEQLSQQLQQSRQEFDRRMAESKAEFDRKMAESKAESDRRQAEADRRLAEMKAESDRLAAEAKAEADRRQAEADRRQAEADRRAEEARIEADRRQAEADRRAEEARIEAERRKIEADRSMAQLQKTVDRTSKAVDSLTTRWGRFVEELVEPAVIKLFRERGIDVKETFSRGKVTRQGVAMEIDIVAVDDTELVAVECKSRLSKDDVDEFLEKLKLFKQAFPHFQSFEVYGAVAGIEIDEGIDRYAYKKGLFVIKPSGDTVEIMNDAQFQGRKW